MSRVNIVKRIKIGGRWKMFSIPRNAKGNYDWNAIADGRYYTWTSNRQGSTLEPVPTTFGDATIQRFQGVSAFADGVSATAASVVSSRNVKVSCR